jgi:hypothetical protein
MFLEGMEVRLKTKKTKKTRKTEENRPAGPCGEALVNPS